MAEDLQLSPPKLPRTDANEAADVVIGAEVRLGNPASSVASKRQRRPSVRLGEIGDQPATFHDLKSRQIPHSKSSNIRPLSNFVNNSNNVDERNWNQKLREFKGKRAGPKRARTNRTTLWRIDEAELPEATSVRGDDDEREKEQFKHFTREDWESSPVHSSDNLAPNTCHVHTRTSIRSRVADSHDHDTAVESDGFPESDSRYRRRSTDRSRSLDDGVRNWLTELGLGRYAPVFEIHQVEDQVLPFLTLEDLKDMGINAVGSRRKMYSAIQKLRRGCLE